MVITLTLCALSGCGSKNTNNNTDFIIEDLTPKYDKITQYNDTIRELTTNCINSQNDFWNIYTQEWQSINNVQSVIDNNLEICQNALNQIQTMGDREGDNSFNEWASELIKNHIDYYKKFSEYLPYSRIENPTTKETQKIESIVNELSNIEDRISESSDNLRNTQEEFATNHGYILQDE